MYIGASQKHLYPLYVRLGDSPTVGQVYDRNMKDIRKAVETVYRTAPAAGYVTDWLWNGWVVPHSYVHVVSDISE